VRVSWSGRIEIEPTILVTTDKTFASLCHCTAIEGESVTKRNAREEEARDDEAARNSRTPSTKP
jgi:hypothetical protein